MKKMLSRRTFLKTTGFASVASAVGFCEALGGATQSPTLPKLVLAYRRVIKSKDVKTYSQAALDLRKWMLRNDPHYPIYHFTAPESWINDPNGPIYYRGKYHLFYQSDPQVDDGRGGWKRSKRTWGHAVYSYIFFICQVSSDFSTASLPWERIDTPTLSGRLG